MAEIDAFKFLDGGECLFAQRGERGRKQQLGDRCAGEGKRTDLLDAAARRVLVLRPVQGARLFKRDDLEVGTLIECVIADVEPARNGARLEDRSLQSRIAVESAFADVAHAAVEGDLADAGVCARFLGTECILADVDDGVGDDHLARLAERAIKQRVPVRVEEHAVIRTVRGVCIAAHDLDGGEFFERGEHGGFFFLECHEARRERDGGQLAAIGDRSGIKRQRIRPAFQERDAREVVQADEGVGRNARHARRDDDLRKLGAVEGVGVDARDRFRDGIDARARRRDEGDLQFLRHGIAVDDRALDRREQRIGLARRGNVIIFQLVAAVKRRRRDGADRIGNGDGTQRIATLERVIVDGDDLSAVDHGGNDEVFHAADACPRADGIPAAVDHDFQCIHIDRIQRCAFVGARPGAHRGHACLIGIADAVDVGRVIPADEDHEAVRHGDGKLIFFVILDLRRRRARAVLAVVQIDVVDFVAPVRVQREIAAAAEDFVRIRRAVGRRAAGRQIPCLEFLAELGRFGKRELVPDGNVHGRYRRTAARVKRHGIGADFQRHPVAVHFAVAEADGNGIDAVARERDLRGRLARLDRLLCPAVYLHGVGNGADDGTPAERIALVRERLIQRIVARIHGIAPKRRGRPDRAHADLVILFFLKRKVFRSRKVELRLREVGKRLRTDAQFIARRAVHRLPRHQLVGDADVLRRRQYRL